MRFVSERRWPLCITVSPRPYEVPQMAPAPDHRRDLDNVLLVSFTTIQDTAPSCVESLRSASVGRGSPHCTQLSPHPSTTYVCHLSLVTSALAVTLCISYFFSILDTQVDIALHTSEVIPRAGAMGCRRPSTSARCPSSIVTGSRTGGGGHFIH